ncbi:MAG: SDR family oxidoreductase [Clostridiaceae bacterium]|nr:SDR family oxidoreductase [Clostridiaceae bacterium]
MANIMVLGGTGGIGQAVVREFSLNPNGNVIYFSYGLNHKANIVRAIEKEVIDNGNTVESFFLADDLGLERIQDIIPNAMLSGRSGLDHFVNCIGVIRDRTLKNMSEFEIDHVIDVNVKLMIYSAKAALPFMNQGGSMTFISSVIGDIGGFGQTQYAASKAAIEAFTKSLAMETARNKIRVNCVRPSIVNTGIFNNLTAEQIQKLVDRTLMGRMATPQEIAKVIKFVAVEGTYMTGNVIPCTGGFH